MLQMKKTGINIKTGGENFQSEYRIAYTINNNV